MQRPAIALIVALIALSIRPSAAAPTIKYADALAIKKQIALDKGHVVLVNFWATWCGPCVAEYPSLVKIDSLYRAKGLDIMAISLDVPADIPGKVRPFVQKQKALFPQYVLKADDPEAAIDAFDKSWQGDIPRTFIYGRSGKLVKVLPDEQSYASFESAVKQALALP